MATETVALLRAADGTNAARIASTEQYTLTNALFDNEEGVIYGLENAD